MPARRKPPAILASDAERDHALVVLREAAAEGRLTLEEFASRSGLALEARTRNDLVGRHRRSASPRRPGDDPAP